MNQTQWRTHWNSLLIGYQRRDASEEEELLYLEHLEKWQPEIVAAAVNAALEEESYFPRIQSLVSRCQQIEHDARREAANSRPRPAEEYDANARTYACRNCLDTGMIDCTIPRGKHLIVGMDGRLRFRDARSTSVTFYSNCRVRCTCDRGLAKPASFGALFSPVMFRALGWWANRQHAHINAIHGFRVFASSEEYVAWAEEQVGRVVPGSHRAPDRAPEYQDRRVTDFDSEVNF
jgi:hypothetical protein